MHSFLCYTRRSHQLILICRPCNDLYSRVTYYSAFVLLLMHETTRPHHFTDNKLTGGQRTIRDINGELAKLQSSYDSAVLRRDEASKALATEISNQQFEKWQTEHLTKRQKDYKQQSEKIRADIAVLKSHMPMIGENFILSVKIVSSVILIARFL